MDEIHSILHLIKIRITVVSVTYKAQPITMAQRQSNYIACSIPDTHDPAMWLAKVLQKQKMGLILTSICSGAGNKCQKYNQN